MNPNNFAYSYNLGYDDADGRLPYAGLGQDYASDPLSSFAAAAAAQRYQQYAAASTVAARDPRAAVYASGSTEDSSSDDDMMPWERDGWVPTTKSGKQKTPNVIRGELQRYIDQCKADGTSTQTRIIDQMGVNSNTFRRFMDPKTYKGQWSATQNGTYWAAAKLLTRVAHEKEMAKRSGAGKRKSSSAAAGAGSSAKRAKTAIEDVPRKKTSAENKLDALGLIQRIRAVEGATEGVVYDTCPQLVKKIKDFLNREGMTKAYLLMALGNINGNSLNKFLSGKRQDQCGNVTYRNGYVFFEKLRILEGKSKSPARLMNELEHPHGFSVEKARPARKIKWLPQGFGEGYSGW